MFAEKIVLVIMASSRVTFQAEAYLPMELQDLTSIPRWPIRVRRAILQMRNSWSGYMPDRQGSWVVWDTYYQHKPNMKEWMPPFSSKYSVPLWRHGMETNSASLALCEGNLSVHSPHKGPLMWSFSVFFDVSFNKLFNKQSNCLWFETCNAVNILQMPFFYKKY